MIDSSSIITVPRTVRLAALALLSLTLAAASWIVVRFGLLDAGITPPAYPDWVLVGMSLIQLALSGIAIAIVVFYSEREVDTETLIAKGERLLDEWAPKILRRVTPSYEWRAHPSTVVRLGRSDVFGCAYLLRNHEYSLRVWLGVNVSRVFVIFWIPVPGQAEASQFADEIRERFAFTLAGAQKAGYSTHYEIATLENEQQVVSIWSTAESGHNLLVEPSHRLFWLQDVAMMVESFWRTALRNGIVISDRDPSPL